MIKTVLRLPARTAHGLVGLILRNGQNVVTAFVQIWANKGRAVLTTLGIVIAVTSIITVVSFVEGFSRYITEMVRGYGTQFMVVHPFTPPDRQKKGLRRVTLDLADIQAVRSECSKISRITPFIFNRAKVTYGSEQAEDTQVRGVTEDYQTIRNFRADAGRFFGPVDVDHAAHVVVLGRSLLKSLECDDSIIGDEVYLDGVRFRVVGLLQSKGSLMGDDQDATMMIPYTTAMNLYPFQRDRMAFLVQATGEEDIDQAYSQIKALLRKRHRLGPGQPDDFRINRQDQALSQFDKTKTVASSILAGIVGISLIVGGIGIMNVMLVSVTERTREIGLRKSVGARRRDILLQFLTEAVVLCTIGGVMGVVIGYAVARVASHHPNLVPLYTPWWSVVVALVLSAGSGIVFGIIPAFKAAIVHPINALRHE